MHLNNTPVFQDLAVDERDALLALAQECHVAAGDMLFYEGDTANTLYVLLAGRVDLSWGQDPRGEALPGDVLDPAATLGGLPHSVKATAGDDCALLCWPVDDLWTSAPFAAAARRFLATALQGATARLDQLAAPVHYVDARATLSPGPFLFEDATMIIAFCEADPEPLRAALPDGLSLLQRPGRKRGALFLALADFPNAHPQDNPDARFGYTETTYFVPARRGRDFGLYVPYIYPSAWEPILLGREIYGFPKQLGETVFGPNTVSLAVDGQEHLGLNWDGSEATTEPRLVRALVEWLGLEGRLAALAFQAGEVIRKAVRLPPYRRVDVYNHKRILAAGSTPDAPIYDVDCLTRSTFGVLGWQQIAQARNPVLAVGGGPLLDANLAVREVYVTKLDMRLGVGEVMRDYRE